MILQSFTKNVNLTLSLHNFKSFCKIFIYNIFDFEYFICNYIYISKFNASSTNLIMKKICKKKNKIVSMLYWFDFLLLKILNYLKHVKLLTLLLNSTISIFNNTWVNDNMNNTLFFWGGGWKGVGRGVSVS